MFTVLIVGRNVAGLLIDTDRIQRISMMNLIPTQKFNFLRHAKVAVFASLALLLAGAAAFIMRGERNYGVDFRGGDLLTMSSAGPVEVSQVREALKPLRIDDDSSIQQSQQVDRHYLMIRSPMGTSDAIQNQIMTAMPNAGFKVEGSERVGALVGGELAREIALGARPRSRGDFDLRHLPVRAVVRDRRDRGRCCTTC
jgi:preprotein translocase subunit SecF